MSPQPNTDSYPAFAHTVLRENPGKNLNQEAESRIESWKRIMNSGYSTVTLCVDELSVSRLSLPKRSLYIITEHDLHMQRFLEQRKGNGNVILKTQETKRLVPGIEEWWQGNIILNLKTSEVEQNKGTNATPTPLYHEHRRRPVVTAELRALHGRISDYVFEVDIHGSPKTISTERLKPAFYEVFSEDDGNKTSDHQRPSSSNPPPFRTYPGARKVSITQGFSRPAWLVFLEEVKPEKFFEAVNIPFDSRLLAARWSRGSEDVSLVELHRALPSRALRRVPVASWSPDSGFVWTAAGLFQRTGDLNGAVIKAAVLPQRTAVDCGVSERTVYRILNEKREADESGRRLQLKTKERPKTNIDSFTAAAIKRPLFLN
ncbi:hypothetical protein ANN_21230 [Periplaneta americana]|uniref:Uncharacterized protein n=1 Tax=Periplaneta americana TaxID=6978 RepID=A0ABQ8SG23_PERAM|nr:hypothetical protein ANN_21230 [Periplaneta americana]